MAINGYLIQSNRKLFSACILSAAGALVFNAFPLFLSTIADQFELNNEQLGLLGTTYLGGFALVAVTAILWISRFKARFLGVFSYIVIACSILALAIVDNSLGLYLLMAGLGMGAAIIFTLGLDILAHSQDPDRAFGFKLCSEMLLAGVLMFLMTSFVLSAFGYYGFVIGVLLVYGLTALAVAGLPSEVISIEPEEARVPDSTGNGSAWIAALALFIQFGVFSALWGFMERIGNEMGVSDSAVGNILSLSVIVAIAGAMIGAGVGNRFGQVKPLLVAFALTLISVFCLRYGSGTLLFLVTSCAINVLLQVCVIYQMGLVVVKDNSGKLTVMIAFILAAGGAVGPGVAGTIIEFSGYSTMYFVLGAAIVLSAILTVFAGSNLKVAELAEKV